MQQLWEEGQEGRAVRPWEGRMVSSRLSPLSPDDEDDGDDDDADDGGYDDDDNYVF